MGKLDAGALLVLCLWAALVVGCGGATPTAVPTQRGPAPGPRLTPAVAATREAPATPEGGLEVSILPDAEKSYADVAGRAPFTVSLRASLQGGVAPFSFQWDLDGDGKADSSAADPAPFAFGEPRAYTTTVTVRDGNGAEAKATRRIVAFGAPSLPDWTYGVTAHLERRRVPYYPTLDDVTRAVELMQSAGVQVVRMDFNWDMLNPTRDEWKFEDYDRAVQIVREHDLELLGILDYVSWWASSAQDSQDWRVRLYSEPRDLHEFARYAEAVVNHYKNEVHVWQIWNEPNTTGFWKPAPNAAHYVSLLKDAYLAVKYADPEAVVVFAGLSGNGIEGNDASGLTSNFIEQAYAAGASGYFDVLAIHPYMLPNGGLDTLRDKIKAARAVMNRHGGSETPLWLTEIGVPSDASWWPTAPIQSEQDAANWLKTVYTGVRDLTPTVFWYEFQDRGGTDDPEGRFGLVRADFSAKPAYDALRELASPR